MDRVDSQHSSRPVGLRVDLADEAVAIQDRHRPVAPAPLRGGLVHLELVVEAEQLQRALAVEHEPVERGEESRAAAERLTELAGVDPPGALDALDDRRLPGGPGAADILEDLGHRRPRHAERGQPALVPDPQRFLERHCGRVGVDPLGEIPFPAVGPAAGDGHLTAPGHHLQQAHGVLVVGPAGGPPRHQSYVGQRAGGQRALDLQLVADGPAPLVVDGDPLGEILLPGPLATRPGGHLRAIQRNVLTRPQHPADLDERAVGEAPIHLCHIELRAEPAPEHELVARCHVPAVVDLDRGQVPHDLQQGRRPRPGQQLGPDDDAARLDGGQAMRLERHVTRPR